MLGKMIDIEFGDVRTFIDRCCILGIDLRVSSRCLYEEYEYYCKKEKLVSYSSSKVGRVLRDLGFLKSQTFIIDDWKSQRIWIGLTLKFSHMPKEKPAPTPVIPIGNPILFMKRCCVLRPEAKTSSSLLFRAYKEASMRSKLIPVSQQKFTQALKQVGYLYYRNRKERGFRGIELTYRFVGESNLDKTELDKLHTK